MASILLSSATLSISRNGKAVKIGMPDHIVRYLAGLIRLGAAMCTAMMFVWNNLSPGDAPFTLS